MTHNARDPRTIVVQVIIFSRYTPAWRSKLIQIDEPLLVKLAGRGAFERGLDYFDEGRVSDIESTERRTTAVVNGARPYTVTLRHTHRHLEGGCDCPASEGIDFCKHCVALALTVQAQQASAKQINKKSVSGVIRHYLVQQSRDTLIAELMAFTERYPALRENLLQKAELSSETLTLSQLKKLITRVTPARQLWGYREVGAYFQGLESTLERIAGVADQIEPPVLLRTVEHGLKRLNRALESVDDSSGYRFGSQEILRRLHIDALRRLDWAPSKLASYLVDLLLADTWEPFSESLGEYENTLDSRSLDAFFLEIEARLNALPQLPVGAEFDQKYPYIRLSGFLESQAREAGDIDRLIDIKQRIATDARGYSEIARLFLKQTDTDAAEEWLNKADRIAKHDYERDLPLWVDLYTARQDWAQAISVQQKLFEKQPEYAHFRKLMEMASRAGQEERVRNDTKEGLHEQLHSHARGVGGHALTLARILCDESDWQGAFETLAHVPTYQDVFAEAAGWFEAARPDYACELYQKAIELRIGRKNKTGYRAAVDLVVSVEPIFQKLGDSAFSELVTGLRKAHKQKRNFIAAMDAQGFAAGADEEGV